MAYLEKMQDPGLESYFPVSDQWNVPGVCVCVCVYICAEEGMKTTPPLYMTPASITLT